MIRYANVSVMYLDRLGRLKYKDIPVECGLNAKLREMYEKSDFTILNVRVTDPYDDEE